MASVVSNIAVIHKKKLEVSKEFNFRRKKYCKPFKDHIQSIHEIKGEGLRPIGERAICSGK